MTYSYRPAVREQISLLFGIAGPSGAGKTLSALILARGLAGPDGKIGFVDTEKGRAKHYAPRPGAKADNVRTFDFDHLQFEPPFAPPRFVDVIAAGEDHGCAVIIIDSASHEWSGEGGCSDIAEAEAERMATYDGVLNPARIEAMTAPSWKKPKKLHKRFMAKIARSSVHLIFCLRADEKIKIVDTVVNGRKKKEIVQQGFVPICEKGFMFEMTASITLHPDTPGQPRYDLRHKLNDDFRRIFPEGRAIDLEAGRQLRAWADTGVARPPADRIADGVAALIAEIEDAADPAALRALTADEKTVTRRAFLAKERPDLAEKVDAAIKKSLAIFAGADELDEEPAS